LILLFFCCICSFGPTFLRIVSPENVQAIAIQHCFHMSWTYCLLCENMFVCFHIANNEFNMFNICANRVHKLIVCYMNCELIVWELHGAFPISIVICLKFEPANDIRGHSQYATRSLFLSKLSMSCTQKYIHQVFIKIILQLNSKVPPNS
jgi:hypothetical protein